MSSHSGAVAKLAADAAVRLGMPEAEVRTMRRAGLVHDLGRLGVSNAIWDKRGPLGAGEWERVRMHPYISPNTAGHHIEHIYSKIDASSRATASLFAMQQGLLPTEPSGMRRYRREVSCGPHLPSALFELGELASCGKSGRGSSSASTSAQARTSSTSRAAPATPRSARPGQVEWSSEST